MYQPEGPGEVVGLREHRDRVSSGATLNFTKGTNFEGSSKKRSLEAIMSRTIQSSNINGGTCLLRAFCSGLGGSSVGKNRGKKSLPLKTDRQRRRAGGRINNDRGKDKGNQRGAITHINSSIDQEGGGGDEEGGKGGSGFRSGECSGADRPNGNTK